MRDPAGRVQVKSCTVERQVYDAGHSAIAFLRSSTAAEFVEHRQLIPYELIGVDSIKIVSPKIKFVTYPIEWTNDQLRSAAELTLELAESLLEAGYELKDASAWNVIFSGCRPMFCDHLSFERIQRRNWWAFGQYIRHFVTPLAISKYRSIYPYELFRMSRDGFGPERVARILGLRRYFTRFWPLFISTKSQGNSHEKVEWQRAASRHSALFEYIKFLLSGLNKSIAKSSGWSLYTSARSHYADAALDVKRQVVTEWLAECEPEAVIDLGCNTGEFTRIALQFAEHVVAVDLSHDCIQQLYNEHLNDERLFPVVANLADLCGGGGWAGCEYDSLLNRLHEWGDVVMMLALIHHLVISESIPLSEVVNLASKLTRDYLIVEFIGCADPMVTQLSSARDRDPFDFNLDAQVLAFTQKFSVVQRVKLPGGLRELALLRKLVL